MQEAIVDKGHKQWWVSPYEHLNYFNRDSLKLLFESNGFEVAKETVTFPIDLFVLMGLDYLESPEKGKDAHQMRKSLEFLLNETGNLSLMEDLYESFNAIGVGSRIVFT